MIKNQFILVLILSAIFIISCSDTENIQASSENTTNTTTNNNTIQADTSKEAKIAALVKEGAELVEATILAKRRADSVRNANETRKWVYKIGDSYDDDDLVAKAYDKLKETDEDIYVFKKGRKNYLLIKGEGVSLKEELEDSIEIIKKRTHKAIELIDLSIICRKSPQVTDQIKYKIDGEKKYANCKSCE